MRRSTRSAVATLELVLCMPVLLALMIGLVWLGFAVVAQSRVTVEARHRAWQQRFDAGSSEPLNFLDDDIVTGDATETVRISPLVDDVAPPEASHDVAAGSWDHAALDLNQTPSWEHYVKAAVNAKTGGLQVAYVDTRNELEQLQGEAGQLMLRELQETIQTFLENPLNQFQSLGEGLQESTNDDADQAKRTIQREIDDKRNEIRDVERKLRALKSAERDAEGDAKTSLESRIKIQRNKLDRLKTELKLLRRERASVT